MLTNFYGFICFMFYDFYCFILYFIQMIFIRSHQYHLPFLSIVLIWTGAYTSSSFILLSHFYYLIQILIFIFFVNIDGFVNSILQWIFSRLFSYDISNIWYYLHDNCIPQYYKCHKKIIVKKFIGECCLRIHQY